MLDFAALRLLLALTDENSVVRSSTIEATKADLPPKARITKSRICNIVTNTAKLEEVLKKNAALNRMLRETRNDMKKQEKDMKKQEMELEQKEKDIKRQEMELTQKEKDMKKLEMELKQLRAA